MVLAVMALLKTEKAYLDPRPIFSDIQVKGPLKDHVKPIGSWSELAALHDCIAVLDEAGRWANARSFKDFPEELQRFFQQARKKQVLVILVVQNLRRLDVVLRELTDRYFDIERPWRAAPRFLGLAWWRRWIHVRELDLDAALWQTTDVQDEADVQGKTIMNRWMLMPGEPLDESLFLPFWPMLFRIPKIAWASYDTRQILELVKKDLFKDPEAKKR